MKRAEYNPHMGQRDQGEGLQEERAWRTFPRGREGSNLGPGLTREGEAAGLCGARTVAFSFSFLLSAWSTEGQMVIRLAASPSCKIRADQEPVSPIPKEETGLWDNQKRKLRKAEGFLSCWQEVGKCGQSLMTQPP